MADCTLVVQQEEMTFLWRIMDSYYKEETKKFGYICPKCEYRIEL